MKTKLVKDLDLKPGDILLLQIKGFVGKLVWLMQAINGDLSRWTHVAIVLDAETIFEAQPGGAVISNLGDYATRPGAVVRFHQTPVLGGGVRLSSIEDVLDKGHVAVFDTSMPTRKAIVTIARSMTDIGYNWGTYLYLATYRLGIRPAWLKKRVQNDKRVICSQAADLVYQMAKVHLFVDKRMPYDVTPGDLATLT